MKILYLSSGVFDKGGISRYNRAQITALRELLGSENINVLSLLGRSSSRNDFEAPFVVNWSNPSNNIGWTGKSKFIYRLLHDAINFQPNIIWCAHLHYSFWAKIISKIIGCLLILQVYGLEVWTKRWYRPDVRWGLRLADKIISDCHFTAYYINRLYRLRDDISVIWDPVDVDRFTPGCPATNLLEKYKIPNPNHCFNILTLGRLSQETEYKGYLRLLDVGVKLSGEFSIIYAGGGDLINKIRNRAYELGISKRVVFTDFVQEGELPDIYRAASVFCLIGDRGPGRGEGIPLTPLEAAACGVPILVGNQDGSQEAVEDGISGYALDPFDTDTISGLISYLKNHPEKRIKMGREARARIEREHAYPIFRARHNNFIDQLNL